MRNEFDENPDYKSIYTETVAIFKKSNHFSSGPFDETYFSMRVYETAKKIISRIEEKVDLNVVLCATILHDLGKIDLDKSKLFDERGFTPEVRVEWKKHPFLSLRIARDILKNKGHSDEFIESVLYLIENHDKQEMKEKSVELMIMQDADIIADIGMTGFFRSFLYCGKFQKSIIESIKHIKTRIDRAEKDDFLNLDLSRKIAKEEMDYYYDLRDKLCCLINSDLLE